LSPSCNPEGRCGRADIISQARTAPSDSPVPRRSAEISPLARNARIRRRSERRPWDRFRPQADRWEPAKQARVIRRAGRNGETCKPPESVYEIAGAERYLTLGGQGVANDPG